MFQWTDYLTLAKTLAASPDEAALRTAISRAYYGALHIAEEVCVSSHVLIPQEVLRGTKIDRSHHARVITALTRDNDQHLRNAGDLLDAMRVLRNRADYEAIFRGNVDAVAHDSILHAEQIRKDLDMFLRGR